MDHRLQRGLQQFNNHVGIKFQLYNSLFTSLPFHRIERTGILLSLLLNNCEDGYKKGLSPVQILEDFFERHTPYTKEEERMDMLFRFVQYAERQVVLFDALEDAAFKEIYDLDGAGTLKNLEAEVIKQRKEDEFEKKLEEYSVRLVLTAHPTQFYPGTVLGIINDLSKALAENNASLINMYLQQLGKTPFFKKIKPTPYDEAISLIWFLENVFYSACGKIVTSLQDHFYDALRKNNPLIEMGFWPGGDRDGNPEVNTETTLKVATALRGSIIKCYYLDIRKIRRRLTFEGLETILSQLEKELYDNIFIPGQRTALTKEHIIGELEKVKEILIYQHNGLFLSLVENLLNKVYVFGLHFASLDLRQDSKEHTKVLDLIAATKHILPGNYNDLSETEKINQLLSISENIDPLQFDDELVKDTLQSVQAVKEIQSYNGEEGCNRYVISRCNSALNVIEVFGLFLLCGWKKEELNMDIVPLFETIDDLVHAPGIMEMLYTNPVYKQHLQKRGNKQTIMLGFSDGTKDGGYLMANWSIYKAKEALTKISEEKGIGVVFFDGRGGPPARGGGKTHRFYASMGKEIANKEIQLTIQGQTVSSNFGTIESAQYNIEQLLNAGISNGLLVKQERTLQKEEEVLLQQLADLSFASYQSLKNHPDFLNYLSHVSPLRFYGATNIGSRPTKRSTGKLSLNDLRAIPFVGAWSQLKQNVTGYFGVGTAIQQMDQQGRLAEVKKMYKHSLFFKALMDNCEMSMQKCYFPLTKHLSKHPQFSEIYNIIYEEFELTKKYVFILSGNNELMADYPVEQISIQMRERIVLPLTTIQQYAIIKAGEMEDQMINVPLKTTYEKLAMRCSFGIINAGRNSA